MAHRQRILVRRLALTLVSASLALAAFGALPATAFGGARQPRVDEPGKAGPERGKTPAELEIARRVLESLKRPEEPTGGEEVKRAVQAVDLRDKKPGLKKPDVRLIRPRLTQPEVVAAIDALSRLVARTDTLDHVFSDRLLANNPWSTAPQWIRLSPHEQVSMLVRSALSVSAENAAKTLAVMSKALAQKYATVNRDPALRRYLKLETLPPPVELPKLSEQQLQSQKLVGRHARAVDALSRYLEITSVSVKDLAVAAGLPPERAEEIQITHLGDPTTALNTIALESKDQHAEPLGELGDALVFAHRRQGHLGLERGCVSGAGVLHGLGSSFIEEQALSTRP